VRCDDRQETPGFAITNPSMTVAYAIAALNHGLPSFSTTVTMVFCRSQPPSEPRWLQYFVDKQQTVSLAQRQGRLRTAARISYLAAQSVL